MRVNEPITDHEFEIPDGEPLVSRTDRGGPSSLPTTCLSRCSGFAEQELIGSPHNIVRHPHMPQEAFANLWATIKAGRPWDGLVKNRRQDRRLLLGARQRHAGGRERRGDRLHLDPLEADPRADRPGAERAYAAIRAGNAKGIALADGELVPARRARLAGRLGAFGDGPAAGGDGRRDCWRSSLVGWLGFSGMAGSNDALRHVYDHDLVAVNQLRTIVDRFATTGTTSRR